MNENAERGRMSEIVEAEQTIKVLSSELIKFRDIAAKWQIEFNVRLENDPSGHRMIQIQAKTGDRGTVKTLSAFDIEYFKDDQTNIANDLALKILVEILGEVAREELVPQLTKAMSTVIQLQKSSL